MWLLVQTMSDQLQQHSDESFHPLFPEFQGAHPDAISVMAKEAASVTLTIMTALEDTIPDLAQRKRVCVHVVSAEYRDDGDLAFPPPLTTSCGNIR